MEKVRVDRLIVLVSEHKELYDMSTKLYHNTSLRGCVGTDWTDHFLFRKVYYLLLIKMITLATVALTSLSNMLSN